LLKSRPVSTCVNVVFTSGVDTQVSSQPIDNTNDTEVEGEGVKVSTPKPSEDDYYADLMEGMIPLDPEPRKVTDFSDDEFGF